MATWYGGEDETIREVYEGLKAAGMLRGSHLNDQVVLAPHSVDRNPLSGAKLAIALSALGAFDRLHIEMDRCTGTITVARDSEDWKIVRLADTLAQGCDDELAEAVKLAGGPKAVARKIREMARQR